MEDIRPRGRSKELIEVTPRFGKPGQEPESGGGDEVGSKLRPWVAKAREIKEIKPRFTRDQDTPKFSREEIHPRFAPEVSKPRFTPEVNKLRFAPEVNKSRFSPEVSKSRFSLQDDAVSKPRSLHDDNYSRKV